MMENENLEKLFKRLQGSFDIEEPAIGHESRFLEKMNATKGVVQMRPKRKNWWKPMSIAASILVLCTIGFGLFNSGITTEEKVAEISPEVSNTEFYFANLIEQQVRELESKSSPETEKIIADTMTQLKKLEKNYGQLEQDLLNGGNSKLLLSAMITNFQTRIDLLQDVLGQIETIQTLKDYNDENITI